jgi:tripartite-type tricarboxylate transporter receptor subunit TctC
MKQLLGLLALATALLAGQAFAQAFPSRPITLICPWPPGGSTDLHLRKFAEVASSPTRPMGWSRRRAWSRSS